MIRKLLEVVVKASRVMIGTGSLILCVALLGACKTAPQAKDPNFLGNYTPQELDVIMANTVPQNSSELKPKEVGFMFFPQTNIVRMALHSGTANVYVFMSQENREAMIQAMQTYIESYQAGSLNDKNDKKKAFFGKSDTFIQWGLLAPTHYGKPTLRFEYQLITKDKPYFIIGNATSPETDDEGYKVKNGGNSPALRIAFSPIQCQRVIELINQDALMSIVKKLDDEAAQFDIPADTATSSDGSSATSGDEPKALF